MPNDNFIDYLHELLEPAGKVSARGMFGGHGIYVDGTIIGIVVEGMLYLKADAPTEPQFAAAGSAPFVYPSSKGPMTMSYWSAPDGALDSCEAMAPWATLALEAARRKGAAKKPGSSAKRKQAKPKPTSLAKRKQAPTGSTPPARRTHPRKPR